MWAASFYLDDSLSQKKKKRLQKIIYTAFQKAPILNLYLHFFIFKTDS